MTRLRCPSLLPLTLYALLIAATTVLSGCDSAEGGSEGVADCNSRTGNTISRNAGGTARCSDIGNASIFNDGGPRLSILGVFSDAPGASVPLNVEAPAEGTFDLTDATTENDAMYAPENETSYVVDRSEGSGTVTISELSGERVKGTFAFEGVG